MKKDKLYKINKQNKPIFAAGVDRVHQNIFDGMTTSFLGKDYSQSFLDNTKNVAGVPGGDGSGLAKNTVGSGSNFNWGGAAMGIAGAIPNTPMQIGGNTAKNGVWDAADPTWYLANGRSNAAGDAMSGLGVNVTKAGLQSGNGWVALAGAGLKVAGSLANAIGGTKENTKNVNAIKDNTATMRQAGNILQNASTTSDILNASGFMGSASNFSQGDLYTGGWSRRSKRKARNKAQNLINAQDSALAYQNNALATGVQNIMQKQNDNIMSNFAAYGGLLDNGVGEDMGAVNYSFMQDYLSAKNRQNAVKDRNSSIFMGTPSTMFALGGDLQTHGADWSTGLKRVDAGGSHEENPQDGVQMGVDSQGIPNLVEENETIWNDYVFSNRIMIDDATKKQFHIGKNKQMSFADLSKKLEKQAEERPNDPISKGTLNAQMESLVQHQERRKAEIQAEEAKKAFEALSPEEQTAIMQQAAQQEQQAAMNQQAQMEVQQQPTQEDIAMQQQREQQQMMQDPSMQQEGYMGACGGKLHKFSKGGELFKRLGFHTMSDFINWAKENNIFPEDNNQKSSTSYWDEAGFNSPDDIDWDRLMQSTSFKQALAKEDAALADAISRGYDFSVYRPSNTEKATIQSINKGNWENTNGLGWFGSEDLAYKQAVEGLTDDQIKALTTEQLAERLKNTEAYKNTSKWLQNSDNALLYLNTLLNDPDTPQVAKDYASKFVKDGNWKDGFQYDYASVFGKDGKGVRETNPGTYWHTAMEANRGRQNTNYVINDDGTVEEIIGDIPTSWKTAGSYAYATPENDITYNYYRRPVAAVSAKPEENIEDDTLVPNYKPEWPRYAGLFGPAVGLGMMAAGVGKPDYSRLEAAVEMANQGSAAADYKPIGNYLTYRPMDIWAEQNRMDAATRATARAIQNSAAPQGTRMAGLLANDYNSQIANGELYRKALEYNDAQRKKVEEFNRGTDQFNADAYNQTSRFNADARNRNKQYSANLAMDAAKARMDADASWYNSLYGNVSGLFKGISDLGVENKNDNMITWMMANGVYPRINPNDEYTKKRFRNK